MVWGTLSSTQHPALPAPLEPTHSLEVEVLGAGPPSRDALQRGQAEPWGTVPGTSESSLNLVC